MYESSHQRHAKRRKKNVEKDLERRRLCRIFRRISRHLDELVPRPSILPDNRLPLEPVPANAWDELSPEHPVDAACHEDGDTDYAVQVVRQALVDVLAVCGRDEWRDGEVHVREEEEDGDRESGLERREPLVLRAVDVQVDQGAGNEHVDDRERVGDDVEDEVVGVAGGRGEHDDHRDQPVLEETGQRRVAGLVGRPEAGKGEDAFATEFLDETALGEDDTHGVAEGGEGDEDRESSFSTGPKDVAEERRCENTAGRKDFFLGNSGEVGDL